MANTTFYNKGSMYAKHGFPALLDCNFVVASANANGITSLKGPGFANVYMASGSPAAGNPNPAAGLIVVQLTDNYKSYLASFGAIISPTSGAAVKIDNSALTAGVGYVITTLGNSTAAVWHAIGVPAGITPAVGVSFIALTVGAGANASTSRVMTAAAAGSGVASIEAIGNPNSLIAPSPTSAQGYGASAIFQCRDYAGAPVAPTDGSIISLSLYFNDSSVTVQGS